MMEGTHTSQHHIILPRTSWWVYLVPTQTHQGRVISPPLGGGGLFVTHITGIRPEPEEGGAAGAGPSKHENICEYECECESDACKLKRIKHSL